MKKKAIKISPDRKFVASFVKEIANGNYATANSHLENAINNKLSSKIKRVKNINIF